MKIEKILVDPKQTVVLPLTRVRFKPTHVSCLLVDCWGVAINKYIEPNKKKSEFWMLSSLV